MNAGTEESGPESKDLMSLSKPDLSYLLDFAGGDELFFKEIIQCFIESAPGFLLSMNEGALSGDDEKLRIAAHTLLPQLTIVGLLSVVPDVERIEKGSQNIDNLPVLLEKIAQKINFGMIELKKTIS